MILQLFLFWAVLGACAIVIHKVLQSSFMVSIQCFRGPLFFFFFFFFWSYPVPSSKQCYLPVSAFILWEWDTMQTDLDMWTYKYAHLCVCKYTQRKRRGRKSRRRGANNTRVGIRNSQTWLAFLSLGFVSLRFLLYLISGKCLYVWIPSRTAAWGKENVSRPCVNRNTNLTPFKKGSLNIMPKFPLYVSS